MSVVGEVRFKVLIGGVERDAVAHFPLDFGRAEEPPSDRCENTGDTCGEITGTEFQRARAALEERLSRPDYRGASVRSDRFIRVRITEAGQPIDGEHIVARRLYNADALVRTGVVRLFSETSPADAPRPSAPADPQSQAD